MGNPTTVVLEAITDQVTAALNPRELAGLPEDDLLAVLSAIERLGRQVDALRVLAAGEVAEASRNELGKCGLAARKGCRNSAELLERITHVSADTARRRIRTGRATRVQLSPSGERLPAESAFVADALVAGTIGLDNAHTIIQGLTSLTHPAGKGASRCGGRTGGRRDRGDGTVPGALQCR